MKIASYTAVGKRTNNEDYSGTGNGLFIVCDGVGGSEKGEVASRFVVEALLSAFSGISGEPVNKSLIQKIITEVQHSLNQRLTNHPSEKGMGTTLALLIISGHALHIAHIGDSRVYFIRPAQQQYWHTTDHSYVQELVKAGIISEEEALVHSRKNQITRAIQANTEGNAADADVVKITEIQAGDLFFICSDGVLEAYTEQLLVNLLAENELTVEQKILSIQERCLKFSNDNNTAILIEIEAGDSFNSNVNEQIHFKKLINVPQEMLTSIPEPDENSLKDAEVEIQIENIMESTEEQKKPLIKGKKQIKFIRWFFVIAVAATALWYFYNILGANILNSKTKKESSGTVKQINNSADAEAWRKALDENTIDSYEKYLRSFPEGKQKNSARQKIESLQKETALPETNDNPVE